MGINDNKPLERIKKESRKHPRIAVYLKISSSGNPKLDSHTICSYNLSLSGMMLVVTPPLAGKGDLQLGETLILSFVVSAKAGTLQIPSKIVWVKERVLTPENEEATCIGAEFLEMHATTKAILSIFLKAQENDKKKVTVKKTCRDCVSFVENKGSKYAFCQLHRITILNDDSDMTLSFNQIYSYPCKDLKIKE